MSGNPANIQIALKKATTEMMVLHLLRQKPMYTYEMMNAEKVMSEDNRVRIYFAITDAGSAYFDELVKGYLRYTAALARVLELD